MSTTQPIRKIEDINALKNYYLEKGEYRNYMFVVICLNTALRVCDVLKLKWSDIMQRDGRELKEHISIKEMKTGKHTEIYINSQVRKAVNLYISKCGKKGEYLIANRYGNPLSRCQAFKIVNEGGKNCGIEERISCHSLRKTFGYHAWKNGTPPAVLMQIYNHSSYEITKRYLGIIQDDKDAVFKGVEL